MGAITHQNCSNAGIFAITAGQGTGDPRRRVI
jgi:hypothetical protein